MAASIDTPPLASMSGDAHEVLRVWHASTGVWVTNAFVGDPQAFGRLLAQLARLGAMQFAQDVHNEESMRDHIRAGFDAEWNSWPVPLPNQNTALLLPDDQL